MQTVELAEVAVSALQWQLTLLRLAVPIVAVLAALAAVAAVAEVVRSLVVEVPRSR